MTLTKMTGIDSWCLQGADGSCKTIPHPGPLSSHIQVHHLCRVTAAHACMPTAGLVNTASRRLQGSVTCDQVAEAMNSNGLAPPHIPQALLYTLLQAPALLAALRSMIAGAGATKSASENTPPPLPPSSLPRPLSTPHPNAANLVFLKIGYCQASSTRDAPAWVCLGPKHEVVLALQKSYFMLICRASTAAGLCGETVQPQASTSKPRPMSAHLASFLLVPAPHADTCSMRLRAHCCQLLFLPPRNLYV